MIPHARRSGVAVGLAVLVSVVACGDRADESAAEGAPPAAGATSSPFLAEVPDGFQPVVAGQGIDVQEWGGGDATDNDEPLTVLAPPGQGVDSPEALVVSITGFEGYQGGLEEAAGGADDVEELELDGRPAIASRIDGDRVELLAVRDDDLAVRVRARGADLDELIDLVHRVEVPDDHAQAPEVPDPPDGLEVVGSLNADVVMALGASFAANDDDAPGPESAHSVGYLGGDDQLVVMTLPGRSADPAAAGGLGLFGGRTPDVELRQVDGRPVAVVLHPGGSSARLAMGHTSWGDLAVVTSGANGGGTGGLDADDLVAVVGSLRRADAAEWEDLVVAADGGPGLHPDTTAVELTRGEADGVQWLLQAIDPSSLPEHDGAAGAGTELVVDPCLKLATGERACASPDLTLGGDGGMLAGPVPPCNPDCDDDATPNFPAFLIITTDRPGATVRVVTTTSTETAELFAVPDGNHRAAVVFAQPDVVSASWGCAQPPGPSEVLGADTLLRIEILDDANSIIGCIGND